MTNSSSDEMLELELAEARELTGLPRLAIKKEVDTPAMGRALPTRKGRVVLDDEESDEDYLMSNELTKEEMYECLYVLNHVLRKMKQLGMINEE
jgi:hypothetical protein